ncbi:MAG: hypothetical protein ACTHJ8_10600 [Mucilaginibacter sp.]
MKNSKEKLTDELVEHIMDELEYYCKTPESKRDVLQLSEERSTLEPNAIMEAIDAVDDLLEQIRKQEEECLKRVFTRFCFLTGREINLDNVRRKTYQDNPNFWEYYFMIGEIKVFLMSREVTVKTSDGQPEYNLNIIFNPEFLKED